MQAKVPKFIDIEDRVVFGLTWKQAAYLGAAGGATLIFLTFLQSYLAFPLSLLTIILASAFAFAKINDRPFKVFFSSVLHYQSNPRRLFWKKERQRPVMQAIRRQEEAATEPKTIARSQFRDLAATLDTHRRGPRASS